MTKYRVVVEETQSYEVYVEAENKEEAEDLALKMYGNESDIFHTDVEVIDVEEDAE